MSDDDDSTHSSEVENHELNSEDEVGKIDDKSCQEGAELMRHLKKRKLELSQRQVDDETQWKGEVNMAPTLSLLAQFDQVLLQRLLSMHTHWALKR